MLKKFLLNGIILCLGAVSVSTAQQVPSQIEMQEMPLRFLPYTIPIQSLKSEEQPKTQVAVAELDNFQKDILNRIADIYRIHVMALEAQVNGDPIQSETFINDALAASQELLDDYPEIRSDRRFAELTRVIVDEYRSFYGITDSENEPEGEIFEIQKELFADDVLLEADFELPRNLSIKKTAVPLIQNQQVNRSLVYYTIRRPEVMETWLQRSVIYMPMMERIFQEEGLPTELAYLSFIESGLNPSARSWASAVGMWQFISATARVYGLEINWWVDERRDPEKATRAAARHLKDLYNIWGDWHLALANYNISPRGLKRAIDRAGGTKDYWVAYPYLPRETRNYVPGYIATAMIGLNPEEFGFQKIYDGEAYSYDVVEVDPLMPLDDLAEAAEITTNELRAYNPELLKWATPPGGKYPLKIPTGKKEEFLLVYNTMPKENRAQNITMHTVKNGESIGLIARKYGTTVKGIFASNENLKTTIYPGQKLFIPLPAGSVGKISADRPTNQPSSYTSSKSSSTSSVSTPSNSVKLLYKVKKGDTIGHIAEWFDVRAWNIRTWNGIGNTIRVGQKLAVYVPKSKKSFYESIDKMSYAEKQEIERKQKRGENVILAAATGVDTNGYTTYTVQKNDTLSQIAESFGVSISQLKTLNNLNNATIYAGQVLKITKSN